MKKNSSEDHPVKRTANESHEGLAIVLGSGGARGWAHVGVLQALDELGIRPSIVTGTSIGAIIGAFYAAGALDVADNLAEHLDWKQMARLFFEVNLPRSGLLEGRRIMELLQTNIPVSRIEDLQLRYAAVATTLTTHQEVVLKRGNLFSAIRASISIPGVFMPIELEKGKWVIDGALINPLPVSVARSLGATKIIGVDVNLSENKEDIKGFKGKPTMLDVLIRTVRLAENAITRERLLREPPDVLIQPKVGHIGTLDFFRGQVTVAAGYAAVMEQAEALQALMASK